jgi:hypothetical protein
MKAGSESLFEFAPILQLRLLDRRINKALPPPKAKQIRSNLTHLNLLAPLGNPIPPMMPPDMLKRIMPRVPISPVDLDRPIRSLSAQPIRPVVAHRHLVANALLHLYMWHRVHLHGRLADQLPQHLALCGELHEWELDALVVREGSAKGGAAVGVFDGLLDAVYGGAEGGGGLADAVLVDEGLGDAEAVVEEAEDGGGGDPDVFEGDGGVVGGHVEGPIEVSQMSSAFNSDPSTTHTSPQRAQASPAAQRSKISPWPHHSSPASAQR